MNMTNEKDKVNRVRETGKMPVNSRIYINYDTSPPKISFEYPDKDTGIVSHSVVTFLFAIIFTLLTILVLYLNWYSIMTYQIYPNVEKDNMTINSIDIIPFYELNNKSYGVGSININYTIGGFNKLSSIEFQKGGYLWYNPYLAEQATTSFLVNEASQGIIIYIILIGTLVLYMWLFGKFFVKTKIGNRIFPKMSKSFGDLKYSVEYTAKDFEEGKNTLELPMFKNIYMDYVASGDFAEHLKKISIVEHPFSRLLKKKGKPYMKIRKEAIKNNDIVLHQSTMEKKTNVYLWKTVFEFKERPVTGSLVVRFT